MMNLYAGYSSAWIFLNGQAAASLAIAVVAIGAYVLLRPSERLRKALVAVGIGAIAVRVLVALYLSVAQYQAWAATDFGRLLLPPNRSWGYFLSYSFDHYWLAAFLAATVAALWFGFVRLVRQRSDRYLDIGEHELTTLLLFAAGWPDALVMAPLAALVLVPLSIFRMTVLKRKLTTLGGPFMIATLIVLAYGGEIRRLFGY